MASFVEGPRSAALEPDTPVMEQEKKKKRVDMTTRFQDLLEMLCSCTTDILILE